MERGNGLHCACELCTQPRSTLAPSLALHFHTHTHLICNAWGDDSPKTLCSRRLWLGAMPKLAHQAGPPMGFTDLFHAAAQRIYSS